MILWYYKFLICLLNSRLVLWSYVLVCSVAYDPGQLMLGACMFGGEEAHLSGVGNTIRMVMHHFIELKKCPAAKEVAYRKARL